MEESARSLVVGFTEAESRVPGPDGERNISVLRRGTLDVKLTHPTNPNCQTPHEQDEIYIVIRGRGVLFHDGKREPFEAGDLLFVAAGIEHHFEDFGQDLALWRVFYGARGGEAGA